MGMNGRLVGALMIGGSSRLPPIEQPILHRLGDMGEFDALRSLEIGDRSGNPSYLVEGPGTEPEFGERPTEQ